MEQLTFQDTQKLLHAIEKLHSIHDLNSFGLEVLKIANNLVPCEFPSFSINSMRSRQTDPICLPGYPQPTAELKQVTHRYFEEHPIIQNMPRTLTGVYKISDFSTEAQLHQREGIYQQFLRAIDCEDQISLFLYDCQPLSWEELAREDRNIAVIAINRSQRNFTERDRLILNLLRPHLFQAYGNAQHFHQLHQNLSQLHQDLDRLGLIILNISGQIELITSPALQQLQTYFPDSVNPRYLPDLLWAWVKHQIAVGTQTRLPLRLEDDGKQLVIRLVLEPDKDRYLLLLEEQTLSLRPLLELLGLSQRETEVLFWTINGEDNQAIADRLSVHIATVRKHLESIFRKLGVQSRTEAIAKTLEKLGILNSPDY